MGEIKKEGGFRVLASVVYLIFAVSLLLGVCGYCYPRLGEQVREVLGGARDGPVREAFGVLADGFVLDRPAKEVLTESYEVLTGEAS